MRARMARGVSWNLIGTVFNQGSTFLVNVVLANLWGVRTFGEYAIVQSTVVTVVQVAQLATGYTATRFVAEYRASDPERASRLLGLCAIVSGVMGAVATAILLLGAPVLARIALGEPALASALAVAALMVFPSVMNGFMTGALAGLESYPALGRVGILSGVGYAAACTLGGWAGGLHGAFAGVAVSAIFQALVLRRALLYEARAQHIEFRLSEAAREKDALVTFAIPAALNSFAYVPAIWLANTVVVSQPGGYEQIALFAAANNFRTVALFVPSVMNTVGMSLLNNQRGAGDERRFRRVFWANLALTASVAVGGAAVLGVLGRWLLTWFGAGFSPAAPVLLPLLVASVLETSTLAMLHPVQNQNRVWTVFATVMLPCCAALVLGAWTWVPALGALGLAWAYVAGWSLALLSSVVLVMRLGLWKNTA